jgi:hypothetical protein
MPVYYQTPIPEQSTARVMAGLVLGVLVSTIFLALAVFVLIAGQAANRSLLLGVVAVLLCFGAAWLCPCYIAYKELRRRRSGVGQDR